MILIVKLLALGDVLRTTSLLTPLRRKYKERISWLTSPEAAPLLKGHPDIEEVFVDGRKISRRFDWALSLEENKSAASLAQKACRGRLTGVFLEKNRLRYTKDSSPYYQMSLLNKSPGQGLGRANALKAANKKTYAEIWLQILGLKIPKNREEIRPKLFLTAGDRKAALEISRRHLTRSGKAIGFNPGAGKRWPSKALSIERSREVLRALTKFGRPILVLGGKEEESRNKKIAAGFQNIICPKPEPLRLFAGIIELCQTVVTTDSLTLHLANALSKNAIALIGPTSASELDVCGRGEKITPQKPCDCFYLKNCSRKISCLDQIPISRIVQAVEKY